MFPVMERLLDLSAPNVTDGLPVWLSAHAFIYSPYYEMHHVYPASAVCVCSFMTQIVQRRLSGNRACQENLPLNKGRGVNLNDIKWMYIQYIVSDLASGVWGSPSVFSEVCGSRCVFACLARTGGQS